LCIFRIVADHIHAEQFCRTAVRFVFRAAAERRDRLTVRRARCADGRGRTTATESPATSPAEWIVGSPVAEFPGDVCSHGRRVQNGRGLRSTDHRGGRGDHDRVSRLSSTTPPSPPSPPSPTTAAAATSSSATATTGSSPAPAPTPCPTPAATQRAATPAPPSRAAGPGPAAHTFRLSLSTLSRRVASADSAAARFTDRRTRWHSVRVRTHVGSRGWHVTQATSSTASPPSPTTTTTPSTTATTTTRCGRCQSPAPPSTTTTVSASTSAAADTTADGHVSDD